MDSRKLFIATISVVAIAAGAWLPMQLLQAPAELRTAAVLAPQELNAFALLDQDGESFTQEDFKGRWSLVFFGFTHCPDICPITLQVLASARQMMQEAGSPALPDIVLVSVDPDRDTPAVLQQYVSNFGTGTRGVTGDVAEIRKLTEGLGVFFEKGSGDENYLVSHSSAVIVINPDGQFRALFSAPEVPADIAHDLPLLMAGS